MKRLLVAFGTRPEAIKLAPLILGGRQRGAEFEIVTLATGQHREMLEQALSVFGITPMVDLALMRPNQDLVTLTAEALTGVSKVIARVQPDWVVVQGDTTTALAATLAAFYARVPVAHVEAGLRTGELASPWPEEANRQLITRLAALHAAPTALAKANLLREGIAESAIVVTGNTVVDAVAWIAQSSDFAGPLPAELAAPGRDLVLITCHRREHFGEGLRAICAALCALAAAHPELQFLFPVHLNPEVQQAVHAALSGIANLNLVPPVDYRTSLQLLSRARLVLTDSGGIQEEAPCFGVPAVVMREYTERREGVDQGFAVLTGPSTDAIIRAAEAFLADAGVRERLRSRPNPYGDGAAAARILDALARR